MSTNSIIKNVLDDFLSSHDFGDSDINQTFKETANQVVPQVLISLFAAAHFESTGQNFEETLSNRDLRKFLHGLLFIIFGLHNLEILVEFEKQVSNPSKIAKSVSFCTGGLCLAKASLILRNESDIVLKEIYDFIMVSALAELERRRGIGKFNYSIKEYLSLCNKLSSPLKIFVVAPTYRIGSDMTKINEFLRFVECLDVSNRLIKELRICLGVEGNLEEELKTEPPALLLQLATRSIGEKIINFCNGTLDDEARSEIRALLLKSGLINELCELILKHLNEGKEILKSITNPYSKIILQNLLVKTQELLEHDRNSYNKYP